jgi:hypothetical protein
MALENLELGRSFDVTLELATDLRGPRHSFVSLMGALLKPISPRAVDLGNLDLSDRRDAHQMQPPSHPLSLISRTAKISAHN